METFAISIESDSLNINDKKHLGTEQVKQKKRTRSVDDLTSPKVNSFVKIFYEIK